jgi:hypothetical protein
MAVLKLNGLACAALVPLVPPGSPDKSLAN